MFFSRNSEARIYFKAGKNRDGYFSHDDLMKQVEAAVDIFEERFPGMKAVFAFDNATTHQKRADDALSARHMPKNPGWSGQRAVKNMRPGTLPNGQPQHLYFPANHKDHPGKFKGMAEIIRERKITVDSKLRAECKGFKCADESASCCYRRILFNQPDFQSQKPAIVEYIESRGHHAIFYPKFHCELNFIEQCWCEAKRFYRMLPKPKNETEMQENIRRSLDSVSLEKIRR